MTAADMRIMLESHGMATAIATAIVSQQGIDNVETLHLLIQFQPNPRGLALTNSSVWRIVNHNVRQY